MRTVYKYNLMLGYNTLYLPEGSKIIHVDDQYGSLCMWVEQDTTKPTVHRQFSVYGTGQYFNDTDVHIGTSVMSNGLVWHLYEVR